MLANIKADLAYPSTLISIFSRRLLNRDDFELLINNNDSEDIEAILVKAGLNPQLLEVKENEAGQAAFPEMESLFFTEFLNEAVRLVRAFSGPKHEFLLYWLRQDEICNINTILRGKSSHRSSEDIRPQLYDLGPFSSLALDDLLRAENVVEVLRQLEGSYYSSMAHYTLIDFEQEQDIFNLETSLERQYFIGLQRRLKMLTEIDRKSLHPLVGRLIDQINLVRLLRYRLNYNLSPSHTYFLLSPGGYRLRQQHLLELVKVSSLEDISNSLPLFLVHLLKPATSIQMIHIMMENEAIDASHLILGNEVFSFTRVFAFLLFRKHQLLKIHSILKGKAMKSSVDTIRFAVGLK